MRPFWLDGSGPFSKCLYFWLCGFYGLLGGCLPSNTGHFLLRPAAPPVHHGARIFAHTLCELRVPASMMKPEREKVPQRERCTQGGAYRPAHVACAVDADPCATEYNRRNRRLLRFEL